MGGDVVCGARSERRIRMNNEIKELAALCRESKYIDPSLYDKYDVKKGMRDLNGNGVVCGLTNIGEVHGTDNGHAAKGELYYCGYKINDILKGCMMERRFGFEETTYLLLFGKLPNKKELTDFYSLLAQYRELPKDFVRDVIMQNPGADMMNLISRCVLALYTYDKNADDISFENVLEQCISLIAKMPLLAVYAYQSYCYFYNKRSMVVHSPLANLSTAENILHMLRNDSKYTPLESHLLDLMLVLLAEHGGGNNSAFTTHVITSTGSDTYSTVTAALCSMKGLASGNTNIKVRKMMEDISEHASTDKELHDYLSDILNKGAFDKTGIIYGMGHAVYSTSDPREKAFRVFVERLAVEQGMTKELELYKRVEELAPKVIAEEREIYKGVSANVHFYSGFVLKMLGIPTELYTPMFAVARISGWAAHRLEELANPMRVIHPAYKGIASHKEYVKIEDRQ